MLSIAFNNVASKLSLSNVKNSLQSVTNTLTGKSKPAAPVDSLQTGSDAAPKAPKAPVSPTIRGLKVAGKTAALIGGGGALLAAAGYGLYAAAPHISALVGTIGASPVAVPVLATIGAIAAIAIIGLAVRAIYKAVQSSRAKSAAAKSDKALHEAAAAEVAAHFAGMSPAAIKAAVEEAKLQFGIKSSQLNDTINSVNQDAKIIIDATFAELLKLNAMASYTA